MGTSGGESPSPTPAEDDSATHPPPANKAYPYRRQHQRGATLGACDELAGLLMFRRTAERRPSKSCWPIRADPTGVARTVGAWTLAQGRAHTASREGAGSTGQCASSPKETGIAANSPPSCPLGEVRLKSGKRIEAWAFEGDFDPGSKLRSNHVRDRMAAAFGAGRESFPEIETGWPGSAWRKRAVKIERGPAHN